MLINVYVARLWCTYLSRSQVVLQCCNSLAHAEVGRFPFSFHEEKSSFRFGSCCSLFSALL